MRPTPWLALLAACSTSPVVEEETPAPMDAGKRDVVVPLAVADAAVRDAAPRGGPSWHADVAPLVAQKCGSCHQPGGIAPFSMHDYASVKPFAKAMLSAVERGTMPPFLVRESEACTPPRPWARDPRLSEAEIALLRAWAGAGAPEGEAHAAPSLPVPATLEHEDLIVQIPREVSVDGAQDQHLCVVLDPKLDGDQYVLATSTTPGNRKIVHHTKTTMVLPGSTPGFFGIGAAPRTKAELIAAVEQETGVKLGTYYECKTGQRITSLPNEVIDVWAPGGGPRRGPEGAATFMPRDALVLMNMHYHPTGSLETDAATQIAFELASEKPARVAQMVEFGNIPGDYGPFYPGRLLTQPDELTPEFRIPAGATDHVEELTLDWSAPSLVRVFSAFTHMHYVGRDMRVFVERAGAKQCLIDTPGWDMNWQLSYDYDGRYEELPELRSGDKLHLRCQYDNSPSNHALMAELEQRGLDAPIDVKLGEDSTDEMCVVFLGITYPNPR